MNKKILAAALSMLMTFSVTAAVLPREKASAAIAFLYDKSKPNAMLTMKKPRYIYVGGKKADIDYSIAGKTSGVKGVWKSSAPDVVKVSKEGKLTALNNGTAVISFTYKGTGRDIVIKCKVRSRTRATEAKLVPSSEFDGNMSTDSVMLFKSELTTNPKAIKVRPGIRTTYKTFYELFLDEACTLPVPTSLASISETGLLTSKSETGKVYLRVSGRNSQTSKSGVVNSVPVAININARLGIKQTAGNAFEVKVGENETITGVVLKDLRGNILNISTTLSQDRRTLNATSVNDLEGSYRVGVTTSGKRSDFEVKFEKAEVNEIKLSGSEASLASLNQGKVTAEIGYKLFDQFGNDVTNDYRFANKSYAFWDNNTRATMTPDGKIIIPLNVNQLIGYVGNLEVTYAGEKVVTKTEQIKIGNPSVIKELQIKGIYKRTANGYTKAMDAGTFLPVGTVINYFGGVSAYTVVPESYYLLVKVKDSNGNNMAESGADPGKYTVSIISGTGIEADTADGASVVKSIAPITVDGETYLTYPLKPAVLKAGAVSIRVIATGTNLMHTMESKVAETAGAGTFVVSGEGKVGVESLISFILYNSSNLPVVKYEEVLAVLGLNDYGAGSVFVPLDSKVISSANSSLFLFKKNPQTGYAELYYKPNLLALPNGMTQNREEVIVLKGSDAQKSFYLTVKLK